VVVEMSVAILYTYLASFFGKYGIVVHHGNVPMKPEHTVQLIVAKDVNFDTASSMPRLGEFMSIGHHCAWRSATIHCDEKGGFLFSHINLYV
jgi:hypothetical protein